MTSRRNVVEIAGELGIFVPGRKSVLGADRSGIALGCKARVK